MDPATVGSLVVGALLALLGGALQRRWEAKRELRHRIHFEIMPVILDYEPVFLFKPQGATAEAFKSLYRSAVLLGRSERCIIGRLRERMADWPWSIATQPDVGADELNLAGAKWNQDVAALIDQAAKAVERRLAWRGWFPRRST